MSLLRGHIWRFTPGMTVAYCMACSVVVLDMDDAPPCEGSIEACRGCETPTACVWERYRLLDAEEDEGSIYAGCLWAGRCVAGDLPEGCICSSIAFVNSPSWVADARLWPGPSWEHMRWALREFGTPCEIQPEDWPSSWVMPVKMQARKA